MNRTRQPKAISLLLQKSNLKPDTSLITKLNSLLQSYLKQHNIEGCRVAYLQNASLLIEIPTATWLIRLQFMRSELLSVMRQEIPGLLEIKIKVNPNLTTSVTNNTKKRHRPIKRASKMPHDVALSFIAMADNANLSYRLHCAH
ncbi:DciA family protein [Psychromonas sp. MME1]|uniref:DciA family protein n=1 Tax=Psychromonas sp. MME1 TaxID=3231032 RepID=UPI0034E29FD0